jgi:hypothetical protein
VRSKDLLLAVVEAELSLKGGSGTTAEMSSHFGNTSADNRHHVIIKHPRSQKAELIERDVVLKVGPKQELQIAWAEVYAPDDIDTHGEFMRAETIRKMAHSFIRRLIQKGSLGIDVDHDQQTGRAYVVENFIARDNDPDFTAGSWVLGVKFTDPALWQSVKRGERASLSFQAWVHKQPAIVEHEVKADVSVPTHMADGHHHTATLTVDGNGDVVSGMTNKVDGHSHRIAENVRTEPAGAPGEPQHVHLFDLPRSVKVAA